MIAIPVGIIAFVKFFGENKYTLPTYYDEAYPEIEGCEVSGLDFLQSQNVLLDYNYINLIFWEPECESNANFYSGQINRIKSNFQNESFLEFHEISNNKFPQPARRATLAICGLIIAEQSEENLSDWRCSGFMVMVDPAKTIRGYYSGSDFEDIDRLILELQVMKTMMESDEE